MAVIKAKIKNLFICKSVLSNSSFREKKIHRIYMNFKENYLKFYDFSVEGTFSTVLFPLLIKDTFSTPKKKIFSDNFSTIRKGTFSTQKKIFLGYFFN